MPTAMGKNDTALATRIVYDGEMIHHHGEAGALGIGAGNFVSEKYTDENGKELRRAAAGLWLVLRGRPGTNASHRVHAGQQVDFHGYRIRIRMVGSDKRNMYVRLELDNTEPSKMQEKR
jgi:hypothetical protein